MTSTDSTALEQETAHLIEQATTDNYGHPIVYVVLRHVSRSGMMRHLDLFIIIDGEPRWLTGRAAHVLDYRTTRDEGYLKVSGAGMDMGFHVVYSLSRRLYRDAEPFDGQSDPGYRLSHRWL